MSETGNIVGTPEPTGTVVPTKSTTRSSRGVLLAVAAYARCISEHDEPVRGCHCAEIAARLKERAGV